MILARQQTCIYMPAIDRSLKGRRTLAWVAPDYLPPAKFIILNAKFLVFGTKFIIVYSRFVVLLLFF